MKFQVQSVGVALISPSHHFKNRQIFDIFVKIRDMERTKRIFEVKKPRDEAEKRSIIGECYMVPLPRQFSKIVSLFIFSFFSKFIFEFLFSNYLLLM